jgi:Protein of unknown function (DUF3309)
LALGVVAAFIQLMLFAAQCAEPGCTLRVGACSTLFELEELLMSIGTILLIILIIALLGGFSGIGGGPFYGTGYYGGGGLGLVLVIVLILVLLGRI